MTTGPLYVKRDVHPGYRQRHALYRLIGDDVAILIDRLNTPEADAVEAQLAGGTLRIVDAAGGLPARPDLTELRTAVEAIEGAPWFEVATSTDVWRIVDAARRLVGVDTPKDAA